MDLKGRWLWFMLTLVKVISSQQLCPHHCLQCDLNMRCLKCVDGYYGELCNIPCDPVCRNGNCRIDGSCHDIIERDVWKLIRIRRNTGVNCHDAECTCCKPNYRGSNCQVPCPNCRTRYMSGDCKRYCEAGFYGDTCEENCPVNCAPGNAGKPLCKKDTGECSNNCKPGSWGGICNKTCPTGCKEKICLPGSGSCVNCSGKYFGSTCEKKCHGCNESCHRNGTCVQGCADGYHGTLCNRRCGTDCEDDKCRLYTTTKQMICSTECQYVPASDDVTEDCVAVTSPSPNTSNDGSIDVVAVVVPVIIILVIISAAVVISTVCLRRRKRCYWRSTTKKDSSSSENHEMDLLG
ncbi:scavenger receptor class F member 1-like [Haliotis cracherodii]|uniref:scavenger receptor class F member 1-like n=1 Tax=Haliotis cracherodii TaxID=6455 RepID=UPI0039EBA5B6